MSENNSLVEREESTFRFAFEKTWSHARSEKKRRENQGPISDFFFLYA